MCPESAVYGTSRRRGSWGQWWLSERNIQKRMRNLVVNMDASRPAEERTTFAPRFKGDGLPSVRGVVAGDMAHTVAAGGRALYQLLVITASCGPWQWRRSPPPHSAAQHFPLLWSFCLCLCYFCMVSIFLWVKCLYWISRYLFCLFSIFVIMKN